MIKSREYSYKSIIFRLFVLCFCLTFSFYGEGKVVKKSQKKNTTTQTKAATNSYSKLEGRPLEWFQKAKTGDAEAQYRLANCYYNGNYNLKADYEKAFYWAKKSADQQYPAATFLLGECYDKGVGVTQNQSKATEYYNLSYNQALPLAQDGDTIAQVIVGLYMKVIKNDSEAAVEWYRKSAEQGCAYAQCVLGMSYKRGNGVSQDFDKAYYWFVKASKYEEPAALFNLGQCYYEGKGVEQDYKSAVNWFSKAAELGVALAQNNLAFCYEHGQGVSKDLEKAIYWFNKSAEQGLSSAQNSLGICYENGTGVTRNYKKAVYWYRKAAEQGHANACANLGYCYAHGLGVAKNISKAIELFQEAARSGDESAQKTLIDNGLTW